MPESRELHTEGSKGLKKGPFESLAEYWSKPKETTGGVGNNHQETLGKTIPGFYKRLGIGCFPISQSESLVTYSTVGRVHKRVLP